MGKIVNYLVICFLIFFSSLVMALPQDKIIISNPELVDKTLNKPYELSYNSLRLPDTVTEDFNRKTINKLNDLASLYGSRDNKDNMLMKKDIKNPVNDYRLDIAVDDKGINLLPGVSLNADYDNSNEGDSISNENTKISLQYWMNNRTLLRANYGHENSDQQWDIKGISLWDDNENNNKNEQGSSSENSDIYTNDSNSETSSVGISYQTNDYVTISADYINDLNSLDRDYSTVFGVEYKADLGRVKYHYQVDYGEEKSKEAGLELGYKDLATFNATYKIYNPKTLEDQLNQWDFGIDFNLNDISTISLGYQLKQENISDSYTNQDEGNESNIKAQLKIKF